MLRFLTAFLSSLARARLRWLAPLFLGLMLALGACGGSVNTNASALGSTDQSAGGTSSQPAPYATAPSGKGNNPGGTGGQPTLPNGTPVNAYLIRALTVGLQVNKPLDADQQITRDIFALDTQAQAAGEKISQQDDGSYRVSLTFSVTAAKYDAVKAYLHAFTESYPALKGKLTGEDESVQNVTAQYVDLQSRLKNLRTEQTRLLQLLSQAQSLSDTLTIQDKLTDVEGQIEQIEGQINQLDSQTSFSTVTINLAANQAAPAQTPPAPAKPWNPLQILGDAGTALGAVLQVVATLLIWGLVFALFWLPPLGFYLWRRRRLRAAVSTPVSFGTPSGGLGGNPS